MKKTILWGVLAIVTFTGLWEVTYPDRYDPKNLHYLGWKWHLLPMEPRRALSTMTHDNADALVLGKTQRELEHRFGFVLTVDQATPYLREYCASDRPSADVLFLNSSNYMVVMERNRAIELILCKG
jgi:hypothetical protein